MKAVMTRNYHFKSPTKSMFRYAPDDADGAPNPLGDIYVRKWLFKGVPVETIQLTLSVPDDAMPQEEG
jgi:hypothetical protein